LLEEISSEVSSTYLVSVFVIQLFLGYAQAKQLRLIQIALEMLPRSWFWQRAAPRQDPYLQQLSSWQPTLFGELVLAKRADMTQGSCFFRCRLLDIGRANDGFRLDVCET
jgi:hypothetical protein